MSTARSIAVAFALAAMLPATAAARQPIAEPSDPPRPGWDDEEIGPAPAPAPSPTTRADETPVPSPVSPERLERQRRAGNSMWVGAAITAGLATAFNAWRASIVSGPCQYANESASCELAWHMTTPFTWGLNVGSIALAGAGAGLRGRHDATVDPQRHAERRTAMVTTGTTLLVAGVVANVAMRSMWFSDWVDPSGPEIFDFSRRSHAFGYYGSLQLSSTAVAVGIAMLVHSTRRAPRTAKRRTPLLVMPSGAGLQLVGRF